MDPTLLSLVAIYFAITLGLGFWVARAQRNIADDYFLAGRKLPWYAVSLSMTGSNIGAEHFLGMVGAAYVLGMAPAASQWGSFIPYSVLIWIFLPFFFRKKLFTVPEFLQRRYNPSTRSIFAWISLLFMVLAVLAPALCAGGQILYQLGFQPDSLAGQFNWGLVGCILIISVVTAAYCIYGGLLSVVWTDVLQVVVMLAGGLLLVWIGTQDAGGVAAVVKANKNAVAEFSRTSLILPADHPRYPWTGVATFWLTISMWYVCTNQIYVQRPLGARSEWDAKMGVIGCGMLKLALPLVIVFPGLIAFAKFGPPSLSGLTPGAVYLQMIHEFFGQPGLLGSLGRGLLLASLLAAVMSTASSVLNSAATIWSIDVHQRTINSSASEAELVSVGRWSTLAVVVIGTLLAPLVLWWEQGIFSYIQDTAAVFAPPIAVIFLAAFLWRRAHGRAATFTLLVGIFAGAVLWAITAALWSWQVVDIKDPAVKSRIAQHPGIQKYLAGDAVYQQRIDAVLADLAQDAAVRRQIARDPALRKQFAAEPEAQQRLAADPVLLEHIERDKTIRQHLRQDKLVKKHLAGRRLSGIVPWLGPGAVAQTVAALGWMTPLLNRAAVSGGFCLLLMFLSTLMLRPDPRERYDPDAIWNPRWARLPAHEQDLNAGPGNLMFWWLVMVAVSAGLFVVFR